MMFVHATQLAPCDLKVLGNNITPASHSTPTQRANRRIFAAVNRSLGAIVDERVERLHRRHDRDDNGLSPVLVG